MNKTIISAVREHIAIPPHIVACANACRYDLLYGPTWSLIPGDDVTRYKDDCLSTLRDDLELQDKRQDGDVIEETYCGKVGDALRDFIDDLPGTLYVDCDCGQAYESEPEAYVDDETGEYVEPYLDNTYRLERREIIEALFGETIAKEFS